MDRQAKANGYWERGGGEDYIATAGDDHLEVAWLVECVAHLFFLFLIPPNLVLSAVVAI